MKKVTRLETFPGPVAVLATADEAVVLVGSEASTLARAVRRTDECGDDSFVELYDATTSTYYDVLVGDVGDGEGPTVLGVLLTPSLGSKRPALRLEAELARRLLDVPVDERTVGEVRGPGEIEDDSTRATVYGLVDDLDAAVNEDPEACPGCGCRPGEGTTDGCDDPAGCGFYRALAGENDPAE